MKRPRGIYALCFLLVWTLVADVGRWPHVVSALSHGGGPQSWFDRMTVALLFVAPLGALPALVGLWRLRRWAHAAFGVWAFLAALQAGLLFFLVGALGGLKGAAWVAIGALWAGAVGILLALWFYVRRVLRAVPAQEGNP